VPRVALAIAYDGTRFESFARQPGRRTVEGELVSLLQGAGVFSDARAGRFRSGSRTDAGVSAAWNVVAFDTPRPAASLPALTTGAPEGLHLLAAAPVAAAFEPRHARSRTYRYLLPEAWDRRRVAPLLRALRGTHDFSNFRRADAEKRPVATLSSLRYRISGKSPCFEVTAPFFLWQQVRRIVAALQGVQDGRWTEAAVRRALEDPRRRVDFGLAPAENLLLLRVDYEGVTFTPPPRVVRARVAEDVTATRRRAAWAAAVAGGLAERRSWNR
jgi:tRNA pseudouridine38-40 synthase